MAIRDLKPENMLFHDRKDLNTLNLIDFGVSAICTGDQKMKDAVGSFYYRSPECLQGEYDARSEVWSLGVILYTFLCGYPPFFGLHEHEVID
jgi:calcium-dependent protein kinase